MSTFLGIVTYPRPRYLWLTWFPLFFNVSLVIVSNGRFFSPQKLATLSRNPLRSMVVLWIPIDPLAPPLSVPFVVLWTVKQGPGSEGWGSMSCTEGPMELGWWCSGYNRFFRKELDGIGILIEKLLALTKEWCHSLWQYACCPLVLSSFETCIRDCRIRIFLWSYP